MSDERICIVLNPMLGNSLNSLDQSKPAWVLQSAENRAVANELWKSGWKNLTVFQPQAVRQLLWTIDEHHPGWRALEFHGGDLHEAVEAVMAEFGPGALETTGTGFIFERKTTADL